jgi:hypothetical protein
MEKAMTIDLATMLSQIKEDELSALITRAFTKGQIESNSCSEFKMLSKEEIQKITYKEQDK